GKGIASRWENASAITPVRIPAKLRAAGWGRYPSSRAASRTRAFVPSGNEPFPFRTNETVVGDTPARAATARIPPNFTGASSLPPIAFDTVNRFTVETKPHTVNRFITRRTGR